MKLRECPSFRHLFMIPYPPVLVNKILNILPLKKFKNFRKKACIFMKGMLIYTSWLPQDSSKEKSGCSAVGSALDWGSRGREFKSRHSDQTMIIRTTLSKWVVCSDLSFLLRMWFNEARAGDVPALEFSAIALYNKIINNSINRNLLKYLKWD